MTLETEYILSFYKDVTSLDQKNKVTLVQHVQSGELFVKKQLAAYCAPIYAQLKELEVAGVPKIIEYIQDENELYVIEEYIHGHTLNKIFDIKGPLPEKEVHKIALNLCNILINLHDMTPPIIHRDIKPNNLILTSDGMLRLIDFDAAKNSNNSENRDTHLLGTTNFAAPEQYGFGASDNRTDIYGFGSTINYLLTGKYPNEEIYSGELGLIIKKCLEIDSDDRFQSAVELFAALEHPSTVSDFDHKVLGDIRPQAIGLRRFLPVGFRTLSIPRIIAALILYPLAFFFAWDYEEATLYENISWCALFFASALWYGNYLGVRNFIKRITTNPIIRMIITIFIWLLAVIAFMILA